MPDLSPLLSPILILQHAKNPTLIYVKTFAKYFLMCFLSGTFCAFPFSTICPYVSISSVSLFSKGVISRPRTLLYLHTFLPVYRDQNCHSLLFTVPWDLALVAAITPIRLHGTQELSGRLSSGGMPLAYKLHTRLPCVYHIHD